MKTFLELPHGIPHDTFGGVFSRLDPEQLQDRFAAWTQAMAQLLPVEVVAIDGKPVLSEAEGTVRRSYDRAPGKESIHLVSAWVFPELAGGMAEIEFSVLARTCPRGRNVDEESLEKPVNACVSERNSMTATVNWRFTAKQPRTKLRRFYGDTSPNRVPATDTDA